MSIYPQAGKAPRVLGRGARPARKGSDRFRAISVGSGLTPYSAEHEGEEGEGQDDDDHEAAAVRAAAVDAALPLVPEDGFFIHALRRVLCLITGPKSAARKAR